MCAVKVRRVLFDNSTLLLSIRPLSVSSVVVLVFVFLLNIIRLVGCDLHVSSRMKVVNRFLSLSVPSVFRLELHLLMLRSQMLSFHS